MFSFGHAKPATCILLCILFAGVALARVPAVQAEGSGIVLLDRLFPTVPVECDPQIDREAAGLTAGDGSSVRFASYVCVGLLLFRASPRWRAGFVYSNPQLRMDPDALVGIAVLVMLHEEQHVAGVLDETDAECNALALAPGYLAAQQLHYALGYDAELPADYHAHAC
jgi:hypothetical protein